MDPRGSCPFSTSEPISFIEFCAVLLSMFPFGSSADGFEYRIVVPGVAFMFDVVVLVQMCVFWLSSSNFGTHAQDGQLECILEAVCTQLV